ncbi:MAG: cold shock domain-containing protein [Acidimicrobiia bacterium]|nr:cold shock domain-containing protein [Acidimicrobiia bacterium]
MPLGVVVAFDEHAGLGRVRRDDDGVELLFHCVEIADGSRSIAVGTPVEFDLLRKFGRDEAARLRPPP